MLGEQQWVFSAYHQLFGGGPASIMTSEAPYVSLDMIPACVYTLQSSLTHQQVCIHCKVI
jgi:hypothetical protein